MAGEDYIVRKPLHLHFTLHGIEEPTAPANHHQAMGPSLLFQAGQCLKGERVILARLQSAYHQQIRPPDTIFFLNSPDLLGCGRFEMPLDAFANYEYFLGRRVIQFQYIPLRVPADCNDSIRPAHEQGHCHPQEGPIRKCMVLGKAFKDKIVHCHDRRPRHPWQQMLGGVEDAAGRELALHNWRP